MMKIQRILRLLPITVALLLTFIACTPANPSKDLLAYQSRPFTATLRGELRGMPFAGVLEHRQTDGGEEYLWTFSEPEALCGLEMTWREGATTVTLDGITVADERWSRLSWSEIPLLFSLHGEPLSVTADRDGRYMMAIYQAAEHSAYTVIWQSEAAIPQTIEGDGIRVEILQFR